MFRKLFLINLSLFLAGVLAALWLAEVWQGPLGEEVSANPIPPNRISRDEYSFEKMGAGSGYELMVDRDLFRPDRKRYIPPEPSPTETPDEAKDKGKPNLDVIGIMIFSDRVKYAIIAERPVKKATPKRPKKLSRMRSRRRTKRTPTPTPTPSDLLRARSYREGEEVKNGWYVAEIRHTLVVFSNGEETFEVAVLKSEIPEETEEEEGEDKREKRPTRMLDSKRLPPSPPDKDEATQRFLDALKKAGKKK